jgi:hypothetical protein
MIMMMMVMIPSRQGLTHSSFYGLPFQGSPGSRSISREKTIGASAPGSHL